MKDEVRAVDGATGGVSAAATGLAAAGPDSSRERFGTPLAPVGLVLPRSRRLEFARLAAIRAAQIRAVGPGFLRRRPWTTLPMFAYTLAILWIAGYPRGRVLGVASCQLVSLVHQVLAARKRVARDRLDRDLFLSHLVIFPTLLGVVILTGGLGSPLVPGLVALPLGMLIVYGRSREGTITLAIAGVSVILTALLPASIVGPEIERPWDIALTAGSLLFSYFMINLAIGELGAAYRTMGEALERTREEVIEEARARSHALESIGAKVAHELKNPLAAIKGLVQLTARSASADARTAERFEVITREVSRMEVILRDYLSFSRPLEEIRPERFALSRVVDDVLEVLEAHARAAGVSLERTGDASEIVGDPRRLKEAFLNFAANAIEATPEGGRIVVELADERDGATARFVDTGRGLSDAELARIGTPFFTTREGGTGLGVVLAKAVVAQHGGDVRYESAPGRGTRVIVRLPRQCQCPPPGDGSKA